MLVLLVVIIVVSLLILEILARKSILNQELSRKLLHIIAVFSAGYSFLIIDNNMILVIAGLFAFLILFLLIETKAIKSLENRSRKSWGILFLAAAYIIFGLLWSRENHWVSFLSFFILAFSDSFAGIIGSQFSKRFFNITVDKKSFLGSAIFFVTSILIFLIFPVIKIYAVNSVFIPAFHIDKFYFATIVIISSILTLTEAISSKGSDNLFVPLAASVLINFFLYPRNIDLLNNFSIAIILGIIIGIASYRFKFLTISGSGMTFLLAVFVYGFGLWKWTLPVLLFFILSSLLSKIRKKKNSDVDNYFDKSGTRDHGQVISNGGFAGLLIVFYQFNPNEIFYLMYLAAIASVCADTWSTEIGTMRKHRTFNILNFREMDQGVSGGISCAGTLGGFLGALVIAFSGLYWIHEQNFLLMFVISFVGLLGSLFDSLLGAVFQAQYQCSVCNKVIEKKFHCNQDAVFVRGIKFFDNDLVNFSTSIFGALILLIFKMIN